MKDETKKEEEKISFRISSKEAKILRGYAKECRASLSEVIRKTLRQNIIEFELANKRKLFETAKEYNMKQSADDVTNEEMTYMMKNMIKAELESGKTKEQIYSYLLKDKIGTIRDEIKESLDQVFEIIENPVYEWLFDMRVRSNN